MIPQGWPLTVQDSKGLWWYVIGWDGQGVSRLEPVVVPLGIINTTDAAPRRLANVDVMAYDADPDGLAPAMSGDRS